MPLIPSDYPDRLARAGLAVHVYGDWYTLGGSADHDAVVLHHTASSSSCAPADDAAYCHHGSSDSPLYNVLIDRHGEAWVLAREKANSSGNISSVALHEALEGRAGAVSAGDRGLRDDTSANASLFAIAAQNDGVGEPWSDALVHGMAAASAVTLEALGLGHAGYVTQHRVLTARKIDCCGNACPYDFQPLVAAELGGKGPPEVVEVWVLNGEAPAGTNDEPGVCLVGLPYGYKSARVDLWLDCPHDDGANLWGAQEYEGGATAVGLWDGGKLWELWLPGKQRTNTSAVLADGMAAVAVQNRGPRGPVVVTVSGT
jgi:N-acetylmuramoyl-L-alanine amidase